MKFNADLDPYESIKVPLMEEETFAYAVKEGKLSHNGTVIVSNTQPSSGVGVILIVPDGLQAPDPLIIRKNRTLAWTNQRPRRVKVTFS